MSPYGIITIQLGLSLVGHIHKMIPGHNITKHNKNTCLCYRKECTGYTNLFSPRLPVCTQAPSPHTCSVAWCILEAWQPTLINRFSVTWDICYSQLSCSYTDLMLILGTFPPHKWSSKIHIRCRLLQPTLINNTVVTHGPFLEISLTIIEFRDEWVSEWLNSIAFLGIVDSEVHIVRISLVIIVYTLESLSSLT